jgi:hypothetical protein
LPEGNRATALTLRAGLHLGARRGAAPAAGRALLVHLELDRHFAAEGGGAERDRELGLDVLSALRSASPASPAGGAAAEHRAEEVTKPAEANVAEVLEAERLSATASTGERPSGAWTAAALRARKTAKRAELPHLVILLSFFGVTENLVGLRDLLESLGRFGIVRVLIRVVLCGELAVLLLDVGLRRRRGHAKDRVVVLRVSHIDQYAFSRSTASRQRELGAGADR